MKGWNGGAALATLQALLVWLLLSATPAIARPHQDLSLLLAPGGSPGALRIEFSRRRCEPVWQFGDAYPGHREQAWGAIPGARWAGDALVATEGQCLARMVIEVPMEQPDVDRTYPLLTGDLQGFALYLPHLVPDGVTTLAVDASALCPEGDGCGDVRVYRDGQWNGREPYLVVGAFQRRGPDSRIRYQAATPAWIISALDDAANTTFQQAAGLYGPLESGGSLIHVFHDPRPAGASWRGWTSGRMLFLDFKGQQWENQTAALRQELDAFVVHEILHLWNAWKYPAADRTPAWLTEGFAEFHALLVGLRAGSISDQDVAGRLLAAAGHCLDRLPAGAGRAAGIDRLPYDCGLLVQWLVAERAWARGRSITQVWREVFAQAGRGHDVAAFAKAAAQDGPAGWIEEPLSAAALAAALGELGYTVRRDPASDGFRGQVKSAVYVSVLAAACDGPPYGFYNHPGHVVLDTGSRCGALSGDPQVVGFNGHDLEQGDVSLALAAARQACATTGRLSLDLLDGGHQDAACGAPIRELVPPVTVTREDMEATVRRVMRADR